MKKIKQTKIWFIVHYDTFIFLTHMCNKNMISLYSVQWNYIFVVLFFSPFICATKLCLHRYVDLDVCHRRGIQVAANMVLALLIDVMRKILAADRYLRTQQSRDNTPWDFFTFGSKVCAYFISCFFPLLVCIILSNYVYILKIKSKYYLMCSIDLSVICMMV